MGGARKLSVQLQTTIEQTENFGADLHTAVSYDRIAFALTTYSRDHGQWHDEGPETAASQGLCET